MAQRLLSLACALFVAASARADVTFTFTDQWPNGGKGNFRVTNDTSQPMQGWTLRFDWAADISSSWNCTNLVRAGNQYSVANAPWNGTLAPGESADVGCAFSMATPGVAPTGLVFRATTSAGTPTITSASTATAKVGRPFSYQITATNNPTGFIAIGLPAGLAVSPTTGVISGTAATAGNFAIQLQAINAGGTGSAAMALSISDCAADGTGDGTVDGSDLSLILSDWGQPSTHDMNGDGTIDGGDLAAVLQAWGPCEEPAVTDGFTEVPFTHYIQFPHDLQLSDRYSLVDGIHDFMVYGTDQPFQAGSATQPRTEMRINNDYTSGVWQFEGDLLVPTGTTGVAVMQVFGGSTSSTSCQLRVYDGSLCYYTTPIMNEIHDKWIHVNVIHDANAHTVSVYLDGALVKTQADRGPATYYFKCGVYRQDGSSPLMQSRWANIRVWRHPD